MGDKYRPFILRALPNLKKLDNVEVTPEEVDIALEMTSMPQRPQEIDEEDDYEDNYQEEEQYQQPPQPQQYPSPPVQQSQQQPQQQQRAAYSPPVQVSSENIE